MLQRRIVDLYVELNEEGKEPTLAHVKRLSWILGELERCGMLDFSPLPPPTQQQEVGGVFGYLSEVIGLSPTVIALFLFGMAMWFGDPFISLLVRLVPGF